MYAPSGAAAKVLTNPEKKVNHDVWKACNMRLCERKDIDGRGLVLCVDLCMAPRVVSGRSRVCALCCRRGCSLLTGSENLRPQMSLSPFVLIGQQPPAVGEHPNEDMIQWAPSS